MVRCWSYVNGGYWCQEHYLTESRDARQRAKQLRELGYTVCVQALGPQVTERGTIKLTMVDIRPGCHEDTTDLPKVEMIERLT